MDLGTDYWYAGLLVALRMITHAGWLTNAWICVVVLIGYLLHRRTTSKWRGERIIYLGRRLRLPGIMRGHLLQIITVLQGRGDTRALTLCSILHSFHWKCNSWQKKAGLRHPVSEGEPCTVYQYVVSLFRENVSISIYFWYKMIKLIRQPEPYYTYL